jgi:hypothetical protein
MYNTVMIIGELTEIEETFITIKQSTNILKVSVSTVLKEQVKGFAEIGSILGITAKLKSDANGLNVDIIADRISFITPNKKVVLRDYAEEEDFII